MATQTRTATQTTTVTANDVREVMQMTTVEIDTLCKAAAHVAPDFDLDQALVDCSILVLHGVISALRLQFYQGDELICEYAYHVSDGPLTASGPPPGQPPLYDMPLGARVRLVVTPNSRQPDAHVNAWLQRLGWITTAPLRKPHGLQARLYGAFASGGFGIERHLLVNPQFDRPVAVFGAPNGRKEA